jgi:hypothetical protein
VAKNEPDQFEKMREVATEKGYDNKEKIRNLIHQVKLEKLEEKGRSQ